MSEDTKEVKILRIRDGDENAFRESESNIPDTERLYGLCPRCGRQSNFEAVPRPHPVTLGPNKGRVGGIPMNPDVLQRVSSLICRGCNQGTVVIEERFETLSTSNNSVPSVHYRAIFQWPLPSAQISSDVPTEIAEVHSEASQALAAKLPRAATILARATLDAITLDQGQTSGNLYTRLENLKSLGKLQPTLADWAHEVRLIGNIGAHDPMIKVPLEDARQLIGFNGQLLEFLYILPADLARRRAMS